MSQAPEIDQSLYVAEVTHLGESEEVIASADICNEANIKLLSRGSKINDSVLQKLVQHKLNRPID